MNMHKCVFHIFLPEAISKAVPVNSLLFHFLTRSIIFFFKNGMIKKVEDTIVIIIKYTQHTLVKAFN